MADRLFTLEEAESLLPAVADILERIRTSHDAMLRNEGEVERLLAHTRGNGHQVSTDAVQEARTAAARASDALRAAVAELESLGVELKDPRTGLVDFRAEREGRVVYLCWRLGEPRIDWWHELDTGFAGRRRLERPDG